MLTYISCAHTYICDKKYICLVIYITVTKCEFSLKTYKIRAKMPRF